MDISCVFRWYERPTLEWQEETTQSLVTPRSNNPPLSGSSLVEKIRDAAGQKGTGKWTAISALDQGSPVTLIAESVFARCLSSLKVRLGLILWSTTTIEYIKYTIYMQLLLKNIHLFRKHSERVNSFRMRDWRLAKYSRARKSLLTRETKKLSSRPSAKPCTPARSSPMPRGSCYSKKPPASTSGTWTMEESPWCGEADVLSEGKQDSKFYWGRKTQLQWH